MGGKAKRCDWRWARVLFFWQACQSVHYAPCRSLSRTSIGPVEWCTERKRVGARPDSPGEWEGCCAHPEGCHNAEKTRTISGFPWQSLALANAKVSTRKLDQKA